MPATASVAVLRRPLSRRQRRFTVSPSFEVIEPSLTPALTICAGEPALAASLDHLDTTPGVYALIWEMADGSPAAYVGMGGDLAARLRAHQTRYALPATHVVTITAASGEFERGDLAALERMFFRSLDEQSSTTLVNDLRPYGALVADARYGELRHFMSGAVAMLAERGVVTPTVCPRFLLAGPLLPPEHLEIDDALLHGEGVRRLRLKLSTITAEALSGDEGHVLLAGSEVRLRNTPTGHAGAQVLRQEALFAGILRPISGDRAVLTCDLAFASFNLLTTFAGTQRGGHFRWEERGPVRPRVRLVAP